MVLARRLDSVPSDPIYIFDFDDDIDGKYIHSDSVARLRSDSSFDEERARAILAA